MRILDRYILKEIAGVFAFGIGLFTLFLTINDLFVLARLALQTQVPLGTLLRMLLLRVPYSVTVSLPMALLLGALLTFGRLSDRNEVVAMRTSGISLVRVAAPVVVVGVVVAVVALALGEWVVPAANDRYRAEFATLSGGPPPEAEHLVFPEQHGNTLSVVYARRVLTGGERMEGLAVNQFEGGRLVRVIEARRARFGPGGWELEEGTMHLLTGATRVVTQFARMRVPISRSPREILLERKDPSEMTIRELQAYIGALRRAGESIIRYAVWLHSKVAFPASAVIFALLAVPLGLRPHRSGAALGLGLTIGILAVYYVLLNTTMALGQAGSLPPFLAAWAPNLIVGSAGGYLLWRAR